MPFRLIKKKEKAKSTKERLIHGKYTKREDTTRILQEQLKKSASTPNICEAVLKECDISESYIQDSHIPAYLSEGDTVNRNAGILMLSNGNPSLDHMKQQHAAETASSHVGTPRIHHNPNKNKNIHEKTEMISSLQNVQLNSQSCETCQTNHGGSDIVGIGYRRPPPYHEILLQQEKKGKPSLDRYRHPPPYREQYLSAEISSLYSSGIPPEGASLIYNLMRNYQVRNSQGYFEAGIIPSSASMNFRDLSEIKSNNKTDKETMTDSYLYPEGISLDGNSVVDYSSSGAQYLAFPVSDPEALMLESSRHTFACGDQLYQEAKGTEYGIYSKGASSFYLPPGAECNDSQTNTIGYQLFPDTAHISSGDQASGIFESEEQVVMTSSGSVVLQQGTEVPDSELDCVLPPEWEFAVTPDGRKYYIDHHSKSTHWKHPLENEEIPEGWERVESQQYGVYYVSHTARTAQREHPAKLQYVQRCKQLQSLTYGQGTTQESAQELLYSDALQGRMVGVGLGVGKSRDSLSPHGDSSQVKASPYHDAEIPAWLQTYAKASSDYDSLLKWDLFRYGELDCWQTILKRMYKKEVEQIVMRFEEYRQALQRELERKQKQQKRLSAQAYVDIDKESDV